MILRLFSFVTVHNIIATNESDEWILLLTRENLRVLHVIRYIYSAIFRSIDSTNRKNAHVINAISVL